ncbi:hypothetical protein V2J09_009606 [Rumex salicifolius]
MASAMDSAPPSPPPYLTTVATQILMCFALFLSFNLGDPSHNYRQLTESSRPFYYFITVNGGFRPSTKQTLLLQQMENVVKNYDAQFVLNIGELGLEDPLLQNGTRNFPYLKIPWYATKVSEESASGSMFKQIKLPTGRSLEIIVLGTDVSTEDALNIGPNNHVEQLKRSLEATNSDWRFVIGFNPLEGCKESNDPEAIKQIQSSLRGLFSRYQVNAYLSRHGCEEYAEKGGVAYMSHSAPTSKGFNGSSAKESDGFFLHKETYHLNLDGDIVKKTVLHQRGHEAI